MAVVKPQIIYITLIFLIIIFCAPNFAAWAEEYAPVNFDEDAEYALYAVTVERGAGSDAGRLTAKAYIMADFTVDVSRTRIVADGFGYAANPYGAVRIWSLSDGFDAGAERRLFVIGDDIQLDIKAYEDDGFTVESGCVSVTAERRLMRARDYLLAYSGPLALAEKRNRAGPDGAERRQAFEDALYQAYARALDELLEIHYFLPRGDLYAKAESGAYGAFYSGAGFSDNTEQSLINITPAQADARQNPSLEYGGLPATLRRVWNAAYAAFAALCAAALAAWYLVRRKRI